MSQVVEPLRRKARPSGPRGHLIREEIFDALLSPMGIRREVEHFHFAPRDSKKRPSRRNAAATLDF